MNFFNKVKSKFFRTAPKAVPQKDTTKRDFTDRFHIYAGAAALFFLAIIFGISFSASIFGVPNIKSPMGDFFTSSYGILSFVIPLYFIAAAIILLDKDYRPKLFFLLNSSIFPFLTLAISYTVIRDFDLLAAKGSFLDIIGKNGISFITAALTTIEIFVIISLGSRLFPKAYIRKSRPVQLKPEAPVQKAPVPVRREIKLVRKPIPAAAKEDLQRELDTALQELEEELGSTACSEENPKKLSPEEAAKEDDYEEFIAVRKPIVKAPPEEAPPTETLSKEAPAKESNGIEREFENLGGSLDKLHSKLSSLDNEMGDMDLRLKKLDSNIETLNQELNGLSGNQGGGDDEVLDVLDKEEDEDELETEIFDAFDGEDLAGGDELLETELDKIISKAEAEAEKKTSELLKKNNSPRESPEPDTTSGTKISNTRVPGAKVKPRSRRSYKLQTQVLDEYTNDKYWLIDDSTKQAARILTETLNEFNILAEVTGIRKGPVITMFEILPSPGVKLSKIVNLQDNIALRLAASSVRIVAPIPGKHAVGIEIPNKQRSIVSFRELIESELKKEHKKAALPVVLGKDITGELVSADLSSTPHLLIAGSTGSGKSVCVNALILSLLYQCPPSKCKLILIDPKIVELKLYNDIPHLLTPVITEPKRAVQALQYCIYEMERRYACLDSVGARDIKTYNHRVKERNIAQEELPYIMVVIDEFADLMATTGKELEATVARLAAKSRAVGIHLVLATQRPSIDVITGLIKSNIPSRIAFMVAGMQDSRIIIDEPGAEKLLGKGDMLYKGATEPFPIRLQGAFVSEEEVERVVACAKAFGPPEYIDEEIFIDEDGEDEGAEIFEEGNDPLFDKAKDIVVQQGRASASYIQRRLKIGYNRAARLVEEMEHRGIVGPAQGPRPRELLRAV